MSFQKTEKQSSLNPKKSRAPRPSRINKRHRTRRSHQKIKKYFANWEKLRTFAPDFDNKKGRLAEGLGTGLQNLLLRFKSGSDLHQPKDLTQKRQVFFLSANKKICVHLQKISQCTKFSAYCFPP